MPEEGTPGGSTGACINSPIGVRHVNRPGGKRHSRDMYPRCLRKDLACQAADLDPMRSLIKNLLWGIIVNGMEVQSPEFLLLATDAYPR